MKLTMELDREIEGRWIAEVQELHLLLYGVSGQDAIQRVQSAAGRLSWIGLLMASCLPIWPTLCSTLPHEFLA
jgi:hypothetical protein